MSYYISSNRKKSTEKQLQIQQSHISFFTMKSHFSNSHNAKERHEVTTKQRRAMGETANREEKNKYIHIDAKRVQKQKTTKGSQRRISPPELYALFTHHSLEN